MIVLSPALRQRRLAAITAELEAGGAGWMELYAGDRVAIALSPQSTQRLVALRLPLPCTQQLSAGELRLIPPAEALCQRSGLVRWARLRSGAGLVVLDMDVGITGSDSEVEMATLNLLAGGTVQITSIVFLEP
jgi:hypothetical protein